MKRFASLINTAALAGAILAVGSAAHATFTYNLVSVSDPNGVYHAGDVIKFAVTVTSTDTMNTILSADIAFDTTIFNAATGLAAATDAGTFPGTSAPFWSLTGPTTQGKTTLGASVLGTFQSLVSHTTLKSGGSTLTIPAGTYTAVTFTVPILASTTAASANIIFPQAFNYPGTPDTRDYVAASAGIVDATDQGTPAFGVSKLTYTISQTAPVTGTLALEGVPNLSAVSPGAPLGSFHFAFRTPGTTTQLYGYDAALTTNGTATGAFTLLNVPYGTYDIAVKGTKNLQVVLHNWNTKMNPNLSLVTLPAADANGDNTVDALDFNNLARYYGSAYDPNTPNSMTGYGPSADFNFDGVVDLTDFNLLVGEFGNSGMP